MQQQPSVVAAGDFLYFAPAGQAFTIPGAGVVSATAKPGPTDPIWVAFALGTVGDGKPSNDKPDKKGVEIMSPMPGTGIIVTTNVIYPKRGLKMEVTMNELSRLALAGFYKSPLIQLTDTAFFPLSGNSLQGWLKRQRYDQNNGLFVIDDWWVDLDCTDLGSKEENLFAPKFNFTWLYSALNGSAI
jgi:hypothetical protein